MKSVVEYDYIEYLNAKINSFTEEDIKDFIEEEKLSEDDVTELLNLNISCMLDDDIYNEAYDEEDYMEEEDDGDYDEENDEIYDDVE